MGDRANIIVKEVDSNGKEIDQVVLYTHWSGSRAPIHLRKALQRGTDRWTDFPYLNRIIFCRMISGYEGDTIGFGISGKLSSSDRAITVTVAPKAEDCQVRIGHCVVTFQDYVNGNLDW